MIQIGIGEATKHLDPDLREQYPDVPWDSMAGIRDILIHEYFAVDLDVVLRTVREDFPRDKKHLRRILNALDADE